MIETGERYPRVGESGQSAARGETTGWSSGWAGYWCWLRGADDSGRDGERGETGERGGRWGWGVGDMGAIRVIFLKTG